MFYAIDGNFHQNMKEKPSDPDDYPMTKGAAYFANEDQFKSYQEEIGAVEKEVWITDYED